jgi:outer membrane murein-binding lipoprotein Lpp
VALDKVTPTLEGGQMNHRLTTLAIMLSVLAMPLAGCGGDSKQALSTEEFIDQVATICDDLQASLDALGEPTDNAALATLARKAGNLLADARTTFADVAPPEELSKDYAEFLDVIDRQIQGATDLKNAARDGDDAAIEKAGATLSQLVDEKDSIADNLGVPECRSSDDSSDTTDTVSEETSPPATAPVVTLPITLVPATQPGSDTTIDNGTGDNGTGDNGTGGSPIEVIDLTTIYQAPAGYRLEADTPNDATLELFASDPDLAATMAFVGVAFLVDEATGESVAAVWIGGTSADDVAMPESWKTIDCPTGDPIVSATEVQGVTCQGAPDSGTISIFTATEGAYGISVYALREGTDPVQLADDFFTANA